MNIERCRACLSKNIAECIDMETLLPCGKMSYLQFFNQCTKLNVQLNNGLPRILCYCCANEIAAAHKFVSTACQADTVLQEELAAMLIQMNNNMEVTTTTLCNDDVIQLVESGEEGSEYLMECVLIDDNDIHLSDVLIDQTAAVYLEEQSESETEAKIPIETVDYYAEDELDNVYLIEYNEQEEEEYEKAVKKWRCRECKLVLRGDVSYVGHMNMHRGKRPYPCVDCRCAFRCKSALARHKQMRHANLEELTKLNETEISNYSPESLSADESMCKQCHKEFETVDALNEHVLLLHNTSDTCKCPYCPITNQLQRVAIENHIKEQHPDKYCLHFVKNTYADTQCFLCFKQLQNQKNLQKHLLLHKRKAIQNDTKFLCSYCPRKLKNQKSLAQHERMHADASPDVIYMCGDCDRQYTTQLLLEQHRKQAHKERDHVCKICGNAFKLKNQLVNHMKLHLEKNIQCPHCEKRYARPFDLNVHMRSHTGELPYACHLCERRFAIKVRLTYHLQKHYGVKHPCRECGAEFNSKQKLKGHSYKHTGMPYRCENCSNRGFANRDLFKRHMLRVHNTTMSDDELVAMFRRNTGKTTRIREVQTVEDATETNLTNIENLNIINSADIDDICIS